MIILNINVGNTKFFIYIEDIICQVKFNIWLLICNKKTKYVKLIVKIKVFLSLTVNKYSISGKFKDIDVSNLKK